MNRIGNVRSLGCLLCILLLATGARVLPAQTITSGVLEGVVVDQNDLPLVEVLVQVAPAEGGGMRSIVTDRGGIFRFSLMPAGRYRLTVERIGYRPVIVEGVRVAANTRMSVPVRLQEAPPPVESAERVTWRGAAGGSQPGASLLLSPFTLGDLPWEQRDLSELPRLASSATRNFEVEGLPAWLSIMRIDGVPYTPARHPTLAGPPSLMVAPLNALAVAELVAGDPDAEWGSAAGGTVSAVTRRGTNEFGARVFGTWAGNSLRSSDAFEGADVGGSSVWGGALLGGAIMRDTAQVVVGFELRRLQTPAAGIWSLDDASAAALVSAADARGEDVASYALPYAVESTAFSAFGRFDWQLAQNNQLSVRTALGTIEPGTDGFGLAASGLPAATASARDLLVSANLATTLASNWAHEARLGFSNSVREHADEDGVTLPATTLANGAVFGRASNLLGEFKRSDLTLDQSLQIPFSAHHFKLGLGLGLAMHDHSAANTTVGEFVFGGTPQFAQGNGLYVQNTNVSPAVSFSTFHVHAYAQDTWLAAPGVRLVLGARVDLQNLPQSDVTADSAWLRASGLDNTLFDERAVTVSPRFGLTWDVGARGNVLVRVNGGRFANEIDPHVLAEVLAGDGDVTVRRAFGTINTWPAAPSAASLTTAARRLALLGPSFRGPRSDRVSFGLSTSAGALGTLHVSAAYRKTSYLPRRADLNLVGAPVAQDQYGRDVYGTLSQSGQLLTAAGTNRRFRAYDVVTAISADGSSEYRGLTVGLEKDAAAGVRLFGNYTYSQTTDNWPARQSMRAESLLSPFPGAPDGEWLDGTSDFDLPHRAVAGVELAPQVALQPRITAIYRFQSGYPFTPGFRAGVDANGDGSDSNDPAFVDANLAGMSALTGAWDCLSGQAGRFAERNSCRADSTHELDLRVGLGLLSGRTGVQLLVEAVNVLDARFDEPDAALVLVDANGTLQVNQAAGTVTVPLIANPDFGKPLIRRGSGRMLRFGLQVTH